MLCLGGQGHCSTLGMGEGVPPKQLNKAEKAPELHWSRCRTALGCRDVLWRDPPVPELSSRCIVAAGACKAQLPPQGLQRDGIP